MIKCSAAKYVGNWHKIATFYSFSVENFNIRFKQNEMQRNRSLELQLQYVG